MRWQLLLAGLMLAMVSACGGDGDDDDPTPAASTPTLASQSTPDAAATPDAEVTQWMRAVCELDAQFTRDQQAIPGFGQDTSALSLAERRARGETLWPASAALHEAYVQDIEEITPPARVSGLHEAIRDLSVRNASELRRSIADMDAIFASAETVAANNQRLESTERSTRQAVDDRFNADPPVRELYQSLPECAAVPTPAS